MARSINRIIKNCGFRGFIPGSITTSSFTGNSTPSSLKNCFFATRRTVTTTGSFRTPERWYTDKHEWITIDGNIGTVGISDYAQDSLGDVVYAQLPDVGAVIKKDEECGALESVKAASELISPVTGKVIEKNEAVEGKPGLINTSCYKEGWLYKIQLTDAEEIKNLMNEEAYNLFLKSDPQ